MSVTERVREILSWYGSDNPGILTNLARILNHGRLIAVGTLDELRAKSGVVGALENAFLTLTREEEEAVGTLPG